VFRCIHAAGPRRHQLGVILEGGEPEVLQSRWHAIWRNGRKLGELTNCTWSYRLEKNIGFALISTECNAGDAVKVFSDEQKIPGKLTSLPFI
jgi:glycine cleavage system aminomethyltransferase T